MVLVTEQLEDGDQIVHDLYRPAGDAGRDEQTLTPAAAPRGEKDANELLGLEESARHLAVAAHRAVVTIEAARIGHEDAQQRLLLAAWSARAHRAEIERSQRAHLGRMPQAWRKWHARVSTRRPFVIRGGE